MDKKNFLITEENVSQYADKISLWIKEKIEIANAKRSSTWNE